jgi:hypothetical protein
MNQIQKLATEIRACVVGALAPYNHGLPLAGAEITEKSVAIFVLACQLNGCHQRLKRQLATRIRVITFSVISVSSVANKVLS